MASTYSTSLRLELMGTGDQDGTWGTTTNVNLGTLLEQSIAGFLSKAHDDTANLTLTALNGASDEARNMVLDLTGTLTAGRNVVVPTQEKVYLAKNSTSGGFDLTFKTTAGTGVAVSPGTSQWVYCDGTNVVRGLTGATSIADGGTGGTTVITGHDGLVTAGSDIASAGTINLTTATGAFVDITGTTSITTVTLADGNQRMARATGIFELTAGASLVVNGSATKSYTTSVGDLLFFLGDASSVVRVSVVQTNTPANVVSLNGGPLGGTRNKIINGDGRVFQRDAGAISDDEYGHDRHYALTQSNDITPTTLAAVASGVGSMMRINQDNASAQRIGYAQIFETDSTLPLRGQVVTLGGKLRYSNNAAVRFAVLEWTGTANAVTSDVVNDWTSGTYTAGNFFNSTTLTVTSVGTITPSAATVTDWSLTTTLGTSATNIIVFYWTEGTAAQNSTLDMAWSFVAGDATSEDDIFSPRHIQQELSLCQWYTKAIEAPAGIFLHAGQAFSTTQVAWAIDFGGTLRIAPTITLPISIGGLLANGSAAAGTMSHAVGVTSTQSARVITTSTVAEYVAGNATMMGATGSSTIILLVSEL